jgi:hypothetical protein
MPSLLAIRIDDTVANQYFRLTFYNSKFFEITTIFFTLNFQKIYNHKFFRKT